MSSLRAIVAREGDYVEHNLRIVAMENAISKFERQLHDEEWTVEGGFCAAIAAFFHEEGLVFVSTVGDCRATLIEHDVDGPKDNYKIIDASVDMKPDVPSEYARITEAMHGIPMVMRGVDDCPRVGGLAVSRSIGDFRVKGSVLLDSAHLLSSLGTVISKPTSFVWRASGGTGFHNTRRAIILCSDGITELDADPFACEDIASELDCKVPLRGTIAAQIAMKMLGHHAHVKRVAKVVHKVSTARKFNDDQAILARWID